MIMKFVKIIMFCVICLPISGISQNIEIPSVFLSSFSSEFSDKNQSNTLTWEMKDDKFIAKFKFEDVVLFTADDIKFVLDLILLLLLLFANLFILKLS